MFRRKFLTAALVAAVAALAAPMTSQAAFYIGVRVGGVGGSTTILNDATFDAVNDGNIETPTLQAGGSLAGKYNFGGYFIGISATSNAGINPNQALLTTNTKVVVSNISAGNQTLELFVLEDNFSVPGTPPILSTLTNDLTVNNFFVGADAMGAGQLGESVSVIASAGIDAQPVGSANPFNPGTIQGITASSSISAPVLGNETSTSFLRTTSPYYVQTHLIFNLNQGNSVQIQDDTKVTAPAPAGLVLVATAVPFFGLIRRRMKATPTA